MEKHGRSKLKNGYDALPSEQCADGFKVKDLGDYGKFYMVFPDPSNETHALYIPEETGTVLTSASNISTLTQVSTLTALDVAGASSLIGNVTLGGTYGDATCKSMLVSTQSY